MGAQRMSLLAVSEAQKRLFALAGTVHAEEVPLAEAFGRWLGRDVNALRDQPWASLSAMDGYAIRHADLPGPWSVTGESAAGGEGADRKSVVWGKRMKGRVDQGGSRCSQKKTSI